MLASRFSVVTPNLWPTNLQPGWAPRVFTDRRLRVVFRNHDHHHLLDPTSRLRLCDRTNTPPQEVDKLCNELSIRRKGDAPAKKSSPQAAQGRTSSASDDFWGGGGGRGGAGGAPTAKSSGRSVGASSVSTAAAAGAGTGRRGQQIGKTPSTVTGNSNSTVGKGRGKVYQKAAAEEDFWGGGTTSGRSKTATQQPSSAKSGGTPARAAAAAASAVVAVPAKATAAPAPTPAVVATTTREGGTSGATSTKGGAGGKLSASVANTTTKKKQTTAPTSKPASGGKNKAAAPPPTAEVKKATTVAAAAAAPAPEWSGVTCLCMGKTHDVVTNCTSCGKIACVKEGGFGCSFCGFALPPTGREPRRIDSTSGGSGGVGGGGGASPPQQSAALKEALERKDRLLLFDRTSASRTRVLDDQGDYFTSHNWLSQGEREKGEAEEKARRDDAANQRGARRQVKVSIDIMGRRVIETQQMSEAAAATVAATAAAAAHGASGSEGVSLDFGSSSSSTGVAGAASGGGVGGSTIPVGEGGATEAGTAGAGTAGDQNQQRMSLENTGLRGRAKEVYDVMRANLDKKNRRRPGGRAASAGLQSRKSPVGAAENSRVSLWRVQHDVDSDDLLRQTPPMGGGAGAVGGVGDGFEKFEPADETACAR